jgi:hypothetical protein
MITSAQKELFAAFRNLSDSNGGIIAQVESANSRLTQSLEMQEDAVDALSHKLNTDVLCIWIPLILAAALLAGLFFQYGGARLHGFCSRPVYAAWL